MDHTSHNVSLTRNEGCTFLAACVGDDQQNWGLLGKKGGTEWAGEVAASIHHAGAGSRGGDDQRLPTSTVSLSIEGGFNSETKYRKWLRPLSVHVLY